MSDSNVGQSRGNLLFVLNIGSTSSRVAIFREEEVVAEDKFDFESGAGLQDQLERREDQVTGFLQLYGGEKVSWSAVVSRGGLMKPLPAGVYNINEAMCRDLLSERHGSHPSSLGPVIAYRLAERFSCPALTVDPPSTDEFSDLARFSGTPLMERSSAFHALSQKAAARQAAAEMGLEYGSSNFIVAHLGGGITVGAHLRGRVVDASHGLSEGPFTPERTGVLPLLNVVDYVLAYLEEKYSASSQPELTLETFQQCLQDSREMLRRRFVGQGGLIAYLGTGDLREVEQWAQEGSEEAGRAIEAMAYQVAKEIGAMSTVLEGKVDAVILTGAMTGSKRVMEGIEKRVAFLGPLRIIQDNEMQALAEGALRGLRGEEEIKEY